MNDQTDCIKIEIIRVSEIKPEMHIFNKNFDHRQ